MPPAMQYLSDPADPRYRTLEDAYIHEAKERADRFAKHWDFYDGTMPAPLKVEDDGVQDNVLLAKVPQIADKCVSFLLGQKLGFDADADDDPSPADAAIEQLWAANRGEMLRHNLALAGALCGHVFLRLEPREKRPPRIVNLNPAHCSAFWQLDDIERVLWYRLQYSAGEMGKRIDYVRGAALEDGAAEDAWWEIVFERQATALGGNWIERRRTLTPYPWPPIVEWQNLPRPYAHYGADDVRGAVALNSAINLIVSDWNRVLKHHAAPKTIGIGFDASEVMASKVGGFYTVATPKTEAEIYNLEMKSDLGAAERLLGIIAREIWQSARLVDPQSVKDAVGALTNFGIRVLFADAVTKTDTKRLLYGEGFETLIRRCLEMSGQTPPEVVRTTWPDLLPEDNVEVATALLKELEAGVLDLQTYRELRGYDHEQIEARLAEQKAGEQTLGQALLTSFARGADLGGAGNGAGNRAR